MKRSRRILAVRRCRCTLRQGAVEYLQTFGAKILRLAELAQDDVFFDL